jgi:lactam utilization protein B
MSDDGNESGWGEKGGTFGRTGMRAHEEETVFLVMYQLDNIR